MPPKRQKQPNNLDKKAKDKPPFSWTYPLSLTLMQVIKAQMQTNGYGASNNWNAICEDFKTRTDKTIDPKSAKNRFNLLKTKWSHWSKLRFEVTGAGWDHEKGCVTAPDEWWANQKAEKFYTFRYKPPSVEMSDLWDDVFPNLVAVGKNAVAPCMNVEEEPEPRTLESEVAIEVDDEEDSADSLERQMDNDKLYDETQNSEYPAEQDTTRTTEEPDNMTAEQPVKDSSAIKTRKKRKKSSPAVNAFTDSCQMLSAASKEFISSIRNEGSSRAPSQDKDDCEFKEAFEELTRLVNAGLLEGDSPLWCYALSELANPKRRGIFNILPKDEQKVIWLKFEYERSK